MKLLVSWLRDFVDVALPAEELGHHLSMRGFELAAIDPLPLAPVGANPASEAARGGGGDEAAGGSPVNRDAVIDLEITPNRPDCLSVIGLAREVATSFDLPRRELSRRASPPLRLTPLEVGHNDRVRVRLDDPALCPRYAAAVAEVTVGPSPSWVSARLLAVGVRPVNNIVDITNYVLMELGQPMHAFDLAKLAGPEIRIRRARHGERVRTLDGVERPLTPDMLVIADADRPQAIAGVMGSADSEVGSSTRLVVFESATFDPRSVRITGKKVGLKTEAAARFERGADIGVPVLGIERACALLEEVGAGRALGPIVDCYPSPAVPRRVPLRRARIARLLGETVEDRLVERVLAGLGFMTVPHADGWEVSVPTFRVDVTREADLIEEVARHYGYDRLPTTFPELREPAPPMDPRIERDRQVRQIMTAAGFTEAVTFSFIDADAAGRFIDNATPVPIAHPLSEKFASLRPSLLPGLLGSVAHNRHRERRDVRLFEIGRRFSPSIGERRTVAFVWTGMSAPTHWSGSPRSVDFFDVKGIVEGLCSWMGVEPAVMPVTRPYLVDGRAAGLQLADGNLGSFGQLSPEVAESADLPPQDEIYVAEIDLDALDAAAASTRGAERSVVAGAPANAALPGGRGPTIQSMPTRIVPLPRFPSILRDLSILVDHALPAARVRGTIQSAAPATLVDVREFDRYQGRGVPEGRISLSLRLTFRSPERTLTDAEVQHAMDAILAALVNEHRAVRR